jgi:hypothetical protein
VCHPEALEGCVKVFTALCMVRQAHHDTADLFANAGLLYLMYVHMFKLIRKPFIWLITLYQKTLSLDHGPMKVIFPQGFCKYNPTCSEYTKLAIEKHGVFIGIPKGIWRILRCNPCSRGGKDMP